MKKEIIGRVEFWDWITRDDVRENPEKIFLFGDNLKRYGMGGQAGAMRGEPNAVGIATKKRPDNDEASFFSDSEYDDNVEFLTADFAKIPKDKIIVIPADGLGTGVAALDKVAPLTFAFLSELISNLTKEV